MIVMKKINNNVAICLDGNQRELVAFGKGIGFPAVPYELTDLSKIDRTFYNVSSYYLPMLNDIPVEVIEFTANQIDAIRDLLPYETSPNLVLTLADHLSFAMERAKKGIHIPMPSVYELELNYPLEVKIGRKFVTALEQTFQCSLPHSEVQGIAMHLINARNKSLDTHEITQEQIEQRHEEILEQTTQIIEWELDIQVQRNTFNYARFATHIQYLLKRLFEGQHINSDNLQIYHTICNEYPKAATCVDKISNYYKNNIHAELTEEEKLYLIMHVNRVSVQENN